MAALHSGAEAAGEQSHVDEAHHRSAVQGPAHVHMVIGRQYSADSTARPIGLEQQPTGRGSERPAREIAPTEPARIVRIWRGADGDADVLQPLRAVGVPSHAARSATSFFVSAIALAGLRPFGQTLAQFMIVWQR